MSKKIRAAGYVRVSTEEQARDGFSLDNQRRDIKKHCEYKEWELVEIFDDEGISGASIDERDGLLSALRFLKEEKIDYLVVWKLSRLSRRMVDLVDIARYLEDNKIFLTSIQDSIDTSTPLGKPFLYFAGIFAEMERDSIIVQVRGGMAQRAREGKPNGGPDPLGYKTVDGEYVIDKEEAEVVKTIYREYLKGNGYQTIVEILLKKGYKTSTGGNFSVNGVRDILLNPVYKGMIRWGYREDWGKKDSNGKRSRKYSEDPILVTGIHTPIVSDEVFEEVQKKMENNPRRNTRRNKGHHLLSGLLRCPDCGYGMSFIPKKSKGRTYEYYICNQYSNKKTCKPNLIPKMEIEEEFFDILDKIVTEKEFKDAMLKSANGSNAQIKEVEQKIKNKEREIKLLLDRREKLEEEVLYSDRTYKEHFRKKLKDNLDKEKELLNDIKECKKEIKELGSSNLNVGDIMKILDNVTKTIKLLDREAQQTLIRKIISKVEVKDRKIEKIHFTFGEVVELNEESRTLS